MWMKRPLKIMSFIYFLWSFLLFMMHPIKTWNFKCLIFHCIFMCKLPNSEFTTWQIFKKKTSVVFTIVHLIMNVFPSIASSCFIMYGFVDQ